MFDARVTIEETVADLTDAEVQEMNEYHEKLDREWKDREEMHEEKAMDSGNASLSAPVDAVVIFPQPDWIRPASGGTDTWHGYCGSGPDEGIKCPMGVEWKPVEIDGVWYWVPRNR